MTKKKLRYYRRVEVVQEIYLREKIHDGISDEWIFRTHISPVFHIDYTTFRRYLAINVRKILASYK